MFGYEHEVFESKHLDHKNKTHNLLIKNTLTLWQLF